MNPVYSWGIDIVRLVQRFFGLGLLGTMKAITFLGSEGFAIAALPLVYWCVDRKKGARIGLVILFSAYINLWLKLLFAGPRPYDFEPALGLTRETTAGIPSGHAQTSVTFWGAMLSVLPKTAGIAVFVILAFLVGLSRIYLGVHFPTDVLAAWGVGALVLVGFYKLGPRIEGVFHRWDLRRRMIAIAIIALAMNFLMPSDSMLPGAFLGSAMGFAFASRNLRFKAGGTILRKGLCYLSGMLGTAIFYLGPKLLLGDSNVPHDPLVRFLRYGVVGLWVAYGAPMMFYKLRLVELEAPERDQLASV